MNEENEDLRVRTPPLGRGVCACETGRDAPAPGRRVAGQGWAVGCVRGGKGREGGGQGPWWPGQAQGSALRRHPRRKRGKCRSPLRAMEDRGCVRVCRNQAWCVSIQALGGEAENVPRGQGARGGSQGTRRRRSKATCTPLALEKCIHVMKAMRVAVSCAKSGSACSKGHLALKHGEEGVPRPCDRLAGWGHGKMERTRPGGGRKKKMGTRVLPQVFAKPSAVAVVPPRVRLRFRGLDEDRPGARALCAACVRRGVVHFTPTLLWRVCL